jgi:hypothetical protein
MSHNKYLDDPDYLFALLVTLVKREGGRLRLTQAELEDVSKKDLMGMYWDPKTQDVVLRIVEPEEVMRKPLQTEPTEEFEN